MTDARLPNARLRTFVGRSSLTTILKKRNQTTGGPFTYGTNHLQGSPRSMLTPNREVGTRLHGPGES